MSERVYPPFRERFLGRICQFNFVLYFLLSFQIALLLLTTLSHVTVDLPPETQAIVYLNFILLGILLVATSGIIYICNRYQGGDKLLRLGDSSD